MQTRLSQVVLDGGEPSTNVRALAACFAGVAAEFGNSEAMRFVGSGAFGIAHYKEYLRQVFHYVRENPQLLATAAGYLRGKDRAVVDRFLKHALEEAGHEQWALQDLAALGEETASIPFENPLPETLALNAFAYYQITHRNPVAHLGYLYFLEFLPTSTGASYLSTLQRIGVPKTATKFLRGHVAVDVHHNRLMQVYADELIHDAADLAAVQFGMRATGRLYASLMRAAIDAAESSVSRGVSWLEVNRGGRMPNAEA